LGFVDEFAEKPLGCGGWIWTLTSCNGSSSRFIEIVESPISPLGIKRRSFLPGGSFLLAQTKDLTKFDSLFIL